MPKWVKGLFVGAIIVIVLLVLITGINRSRQMQREAVWRRQAELDLRAEQAAAAVERLGVKAGRVAECAALLEDALEQVRNAGEFIPGRGKAGAAEPAVPETDRAMPDAEAERDEAEALLSAGFEDGDTPPGIMSREALERMRAARTRRAPVPPKAEAVAVTKKPHAAPAKRSIAVVAGELREIAEQGQAMAQQAPGLISNAKSVQASITEAPTREKAEAQALEMKSLESTMDVCVLDIEALLPGLAERSAELKAMTMEAERARNEEGEVARRREQEAARQRSEAADLARLEALRSDNRQVLVSHQYARLADIVESRSADCQSDVGRAAFQVVVERYRKLAWLRSYIIDKMRAKPLRWGWGTGRESVDVLGADERGIRITGKKIPWSKVGPAQLAKWAVLYSKEARLPRHTAGSLQLALAVLYDEHGAVEKAEKARTLAITTWARLGEEADRLLSPQ